MSTIALIPARGGSKRFPRKNLAVVNGLPMVAYAIRTAKAAGVFDRIMVSTEDAEVIDVAKEHGAEVIERPVNIAQDRSTVAEVCVHALEMVPGVELMCCIYATAVLIKPGSLVASHAIIAADETTDHLMGVSEYEHPPVQALKSDQNGYLAYMWPEWRGIQSQQQPKLVVSNGTFYWTRASAMLRERTFYGERLKGFPIPFDEISDVDTEEDLAKVIWEIDRRSGGKS